MSVMIPLFFGLHREVIKSGLWAKMRPGEKDRILAARNRVCQHGRSIRFKRETADKLIERGTVPALEQR